MSKDGNTQKLMAILSIILDIDISSITDDTSPKNTAKWNSFNMLKMVVAMENEFNVQFTMNEVVAVTCVGAFKDLLKRHAIDVDKQ